MWSREERHTLQILDEIVRSPSVANMMGSVLKSLKSRLASESKLLAKEPVPLALYGSDLPTVIQSSWIYLMRAPSRTGAERHPNSHQRTLSFVGEGDFRVRVDADFSICPHGRRVGPWRRYALDSEQSALRQRWVSIPPNTWHEAVVYAGDWVMVSFHTANDQELIEEHPTRDQP
jgi:hypothetical protein